MSTQVISVIILLLSQLLPLIGITVESADLEKTIQVIVAVATGGWIWWQRVTKLRKSDTSDVNALGGRKVE